MVRGSLLKMGKIKRLSVLVIITLPLFGQYKFVPQIGHANPISSIAISRDGRYIISGSKDGTIRIWDVKGGNIIGTIYRHFCFKFLRRDSIVVAICPDSKYFVSGGKDGTIKIWNFEKYEKPIKVFCRRPGFFHRFWPGSPITSAAISPDGKYIVSGSRDSTIEVWNMEDGKLIRTLRGHEGDVTSVAISPDGKYIVSGSRDSTIKVWNMEDGRLIRTLRGHARSVTSVAISPDGRFIVSGSDDNTIKIWSMEDVRLIKTLSGHKGDVTSVAISPDGRYIVSGSEDGTIRVWSVEYASVRIFWGEGYPINSVVVSPYGRFIISGDSTELMRIWSMKDGRMLATLIADREGNWAIGASNGLWDANKGGKKFVVIREIGTNKTYKPGEPECDKFRYKGLLTYIWVHGGLPD